MLCPQERRKEGRKEERKEGRRKGGRKEERKEGRKEEGHCSSYGRREEEITFSYKPFLYEHCAF
jgi:hypothetical protein